MKTFTIIGGGATGTLLAVNLIKNAGDQPITVNLIEKNLRFARGVAYSTTNKAHLLNVPANKMGAFPDDVEGFYKWLTANNHNYFSNDFVPRKIYGEYLQETFSEAVRNAGENVTVNSYNDEAVDISIENNQAQITLKSGETVISDKVILAFGNFLPPHPRTENQAYITAEKYFQNPWDEKISEKLDLNDEVLIIGTSLTMVDTVLTLFNDQHQGKITAISTHGWLPTVHELGFVYPSFADDLKDKTSVSDLFKVIRKHAENAESQNSNWRGVIDSLRPATQSLWLNLSNQEKRRFMRHARRLWDVSRHRIPIECRELLRQMENTGQLRILKGRVKKIEVTVENNFNVSYQDKNITKDIQADAVINCTGSESNFNRLDIPLVKNLLTKKYIQTDSLSLGIEAAPNGKISENLYTIGTALKGILWESTAMPEIRTQAHQLAVQLLEEATV
jgi:uncharacterized NAD(P)/FAD-binding protein YdhS